jgi:RNA polymerase sigma-70 factor (ECF subfamily)
LDDQELVRKLLDKDPEAEAFFYRTYRERLYQACCYLLGYRDPEAEDITQEAFIVALRKIHGFEFRSSLYRWLYRICVFLCYERIRKRRRQVSQFQEELEALSAPRSMEREREKEREAETLRLAGVIRTQRESMGELCRDLLRLRDEEDQSYAQLSESLKIPIGTVMSRLARCKEALRNLVMRALKGNESA